MMFTLIVVIVMASPLFLGPIFIPRIIKHKEEELLRKLQDGGENIFGKGKMVFTHQFDFLSPCDRDVVVCCSTRTCGGQLVDIDESYRAFIKEAGRERREIDAVIRIGVVCLRCGHLKHLSDSHFLGTGFKRIQSGPMLARVLNDRSELLLLCE